MAANRQRGVIERRDQRQLQVGELAFDRRLQEKTIPIRQLGSRAIQPDVDLVPAGLGLIVEVKTEHVILVRIIRGFLQTVGQVGAVEAWLSSRSRGYGLERVDDFVIRAACGILGLAQGSIGIYDIVGGERGVVPVPRIQRIDRNVGQIQQIESVSVLIERFADPCQVGKAPPRRSFLP